ncbi:MAG: hypothetical protein MUD08_19320 [Cytophagales bacterium]|nr:hypothetical protein [Cytophagales bacterium]
MVAAVGSGQSESVLGDFCPKREKALKGRDDTAPGIARWNRRTKAFWAEIAQNAF